MCPYLFFSLEVLQVDTQVERQQEHQNKLLKQAALLDKKNLTTEGHNACNTVEKNTCQNTNVISSGQQVPKCESCGAALPGNAGITPNAYLARRRFEYDAQGNLFLYSKLETPHSGAHPRECNQCRNALYRGFVLNPAKRKKWQINTTGSKGRGR